MQKPYEYLPADKSEGVGIKNRYIVLSSSILLGVLALMTLIFANGISAQTTTTTTKSENYTVTVPNTTVTVRGCVSPGSLITIFDNNSAVATATAQVDGKFSKVIILGTDGIHNIKAYFEDIDGKTSSSVSKNVSITIHADTPVNLALPPTVSIAKPLYSLGEQLIFTGSTCPNSEIILDIDDNIDIEAQSDNEGRWYAIVPSIGYNVGEHTYKALSSSFGVITVSRTHLFSITEEGARAGGLGPLSVVLLDAPVIVEPDDNYLSSGPVVAIEGTSEPNVQLEIIRDGDIVGSVFSNPLGKWTFIMTMTKPQHSVYARICYENSCGTLSNEITVFYQGDFYNCELKYEFGKYRFFNVSPGSGVDLHLKEIDGVAPYNIVIDWGDGQVEHLNHATSKSIKYHHVYHFIGHYNGVVTIEDASGCVQTQYFSAEISPQDFNWAILWWLILAFGFATYVYYTKIDRKIKASKTSLLEKDLEEAKQEIAAKAVDTEDVAHDAAEEDTPKKKRKITVKKTSSKKKPAKKKPAAKKS